MQSLPVTLPMVEACLKARRSSLAFPGALEALYAERLESYRQKVMRKNVWQAVVIYNIFLIADWLLLPQTFALALVIYLALVTPLFLIAGLVYRKAGRTWVRESAIAAIPFLMTAQIMFIYWSNGGDAAGHYQYLTVPVVVYMNMNLRMGFRMALGSTLLLAATYLAVLFAGGADFVAKFVGASIMLSLAYMSLMAARRMEQDMRYAFLTRLRDQLLRANAEDAAQRDALTGLANRRRLDERIAELWRASAETDRVVAVVMIDIDHFKAFNDRYGHAAGDACLKRVAGSLAAEMADGVGLPVRLGGEEFLILVPAADVADAVRLAERVRRRVEALAIPHEALGRHGIATISLGAAAGPVSAHSFGELLSAADAALYAAKRNGRNQVWPPFVSRGNPVVSLLDSGTGQERETAQSGRRTAQTRPLS